MYQNTSIFKLRYLLIFVQNYKCTILNPHQLMNTKNFLPWFLAICLASIVFAQADTVKKVSHKNGHCKKGYQ